MPATTPEGTSIASRGIQLMANERERQVTEEGWTRDHDKGHGAELATAGATYALNAADNVDAVPITPHVPLTWPWEEKWWKPTGDPIRDLIKAGALIAAAVDELLRQQNDGQ